MALDVETIGKTKERRKRCNKKIFIGEHGKFKTKGISLPW